MPVKRYLLKNHTYKIEIQNILLEDSIMDVIIERVSKLFPIFLITKYCKQLGQYVSAFCEEAYRQFLPRHTYLISCPTGKGKSRMVTHHIIPLAYKRRNKVL